MRGEHSRLATVPTGSAGSSPHARGTPNSDIVTLRTAGIIPACAGNTNRHSALTLPTRDHPRMRGEHLHAGVDNDGKPGSSPHARGTPHSACKFDQPDGIIPACAGNTEHAHNCPFAIWDHPRMRGEHQSAYCWRAAPTGSSPHARGTLIHQAKGNIMIGIIPACAGNTMTGV